MMQIDNAHYGALPTAMQPIINAIAASLRGRSFGPARDLSITLPGDSGQTLVVSVRRVTPQLTPPAEAAPRGLDPHQLRLVIGTIQEKIAEPVSVSLLSSIVGLSRSHFSQAFRTSVGRSPHAHIVQLRIERAMALMLQTELPLSEIALLTGFSDQAHFSNKFRRTAGITPMRWRRTHQQ
jgi:transcriptional regulator GlxA family with amidase domain